MLKIFEIDTVSYDFIEELIENSENEDYVNKFDSLIFKHYVYFKDIEYLEFNILNENNKLKFIINHKKLNNGTNELIKSYNIDKKDIFNRIKLEDDLFVRLAKKRNKQHLMLSIDKKYSSIDDDTYVLNVDNKGKLIINVDKENILTICFINDDNLNIDSSDKILYNKKIRLNVVENLHYVPIE